MKQIVQINVAGVLTVQGEKFYALKPEPERTNHSWMLPAWTRWWVTPVATTPEEGLHHAPIRILVVTDGWYLEYAPRKIYIYSSSALEDLQFVEHPEEPEPPATVVYSSTQETFIWNELIKDER